LLIWRSNYLRKGHKGLGILFGLDWIFLISKGKRIVKRGLGLFLIFWETGLLRRGFLEELPFYWGRLEG